MIVVWSLMKDKECETEDTDRPRQGRVTSNPLYQSIICRTNAQSTVCYAFHIYIDSEKLFLQQSSKIEVSYRTRVKIYHCLKRVDDGENGM